MRRVERLALNQVSMKMEDERIRNLIREGKAYQLMSVMQTNRKQGMMIMDEAIMQLYYSGVIDREMAIQFATDPDGMEHKII